MSTSTESQPKGFFVGETVVLSARTSVWRTKAPLDMDVVEVASLRHGPDEDEVVLPETSFDHVDGGDYRLTIDTEGFAPGTYRLTVRTSESGLGVVILEDTFLLRSPGGA